MAWIESHEELLSHPKSKRLKRKLNVSIHEVVGILHFFWHWAIKYAEDGDITKFSSEDIADAIEFDGDADNLIQSLIESGFVDEVDGNRIIHDWFDYGGKLILWRRKEADRLKKYRADKTKKGKEQVSYEERTPYAHSTDTVRTPERVTVTVTDTVNKEIKEKPSRQKQVFDHDSLPYRSANYLYTSILRFKPDLKQPNLQTWADDMRKLIEIDKREPHEIAKVIDWVTRDPFWQSNILSASKLRSQWDTLTAKMKSQPVSNKTFKSKTDEFTEQMNLLKQEMGGTAYAEASATGSRKDITPHQDGLSEFYLESGSYRPLD